MLLLSAAALLLSGCFSYSTLHTATPVEKGKVQINLAPAAFGVGTGDGPAAIPQTEVAGRYGLGNDMDFGIKLYFLGTGFDFNWAVVNNDALAFALNPAVTFSSYSAPINGETAGVTFGTALMNLLLDLKPSDMVTITVGVKPGWLYVLGSAGGQTGFGTGFAAGGMLGLHVRLSENFALMPSIDVLVPVESGSQGFLFNGSFGFQFGF
jgi:hypothetical protein